MTLTSAQSGTGVDLRDPEERLRALFDRGTLRLLAPRDDAGVVAGRGAVDGTPVIAFATDATRMGGALGDEGCRLLVDAVDAAIRERVPIIGVWHSGGARPAEGVYAVDDLPKLLPEADVVVLLVPLTDATRGLVDAGFLAAMRDGALLVNAARGPVVQTDALVAELATGRISAALDVTEPEPLPPGHPLWDLPNVLLTPHVGGSVRGLLPRGYRLAGEQLRRFVAGEPLVNEVVDGY